MPSRVGRSPMPKQEPRERIRNFSEVALGYSEEDAIREASRCINCPKRPCVSGCPVEVDIPSFIGLIRDGRFAEAARKIKEKNSLPAICGRVCPQETQCEAQCTLGKKGEPVAIGALERFAADFERAHSGISLPGGLDTGGPHAGRSNMVGSCPGDGSGGLKVAVVGSGPAGLTCAADLAKMGYKVTIFESLHSAGGVLRYGIPEFRLPKAILEEEIAYVRALGVELRLNVLIGQTYSLDDLFRAGYKAIFLGTGAGLPHFLGIPGENLNGVYSANEFLTRANLMKAYLFPDYVTPIKVGRRVAVVGAGNVAMDAARVALRLGAEEVTIVYRRSRAEMPARREEVENAEEEGVRFALLTNPIRVLGDEKGWVTGLECIRMELGEPDESGRRRPVPIKGSEFIMGVDTMISAIGTDPNPLLPRLTPGLATGRHGNLVADPETGATSIPGVFAGGDIVTGSATVIAAMGAGKVAARGIDRYLRAGNAEK
ncbi:MAG TPA: NADPH-dependent glutamate synthase [Firmicutes bacterium]|nr:NADPH-dependent glutamate synthase [Bacillota bacterium]